MKFDLAKKVHDKHLRGQLNAAKVVVTLMIRLGYFNYELKKMVKLILL